MMLAERLAAALRPGQAGALLTADHPELDAVPSPVEAAVLVAVTDRAEPGVILTQRTETLRRHAGQVAFPGGRLDPGEDAGAAALREAWEEVALPPGAATVVGALDPYRTVTGYRVVPVLAAVPADLPLRASEAEVAAVFEVPLAFLLDPANRREATMVWRGRERRFQEILWGERRIWGATAAMIANLAGRLAWS